MTNYEKIFDRLGKMDGKLEDIFAQTKKTNGRVNDLEAWKETMDVKIAEKNGERKGQSNLWKIILAIATLALAALAIYHP